LIFINRACQRECACAGRAGGNARGANAIDLQMVRGFSSQAATGTNAIVIGNNSTASAANCIAIGSSSTANTNSSAIAIGVGSPASGSNSIAIGGGTASSAYEIAIGPSSNSDKTAQVSFGANSSGNQQSYLTLLASTTTSVFTTVQMLCAGLTNNFVTIPNNTTWIVEVDIIGRSTSGTDNGYFKRRLMIKKGTTSASTDFIPTGAAPIVVADMGSNAGTPPTGWAVSFTADTIGGTLGIFVTGYAAANIQWVAKVSLVEVGYA